MELHRHMVVLVAAIFVLGVHSGEIPGWQSNYLDNFRFIPIVGVCYQLYHRNDLVSSCRREPEYENQSCIQRVSDGDECLGLVTPTNETVTFRCASSVKFNSKCFEVYDINQNVTTVCQEVIEGHGVGITTPDNFTIIFHNPACLTGISVMKKQVYDEFVNNFSLDGEARSCYKVYNPEETVTPYNCLSKAIYTTCVFSMTGGCTALTTQNNEVLVLDCPEQGQRPQNCFYLYTPDNQVHTVCQKKIEERCVGVVTPSNLTVLFECFFCSESMTPIYYNRERQRMQRQLVKTYLDNGYLGKNYPLLNYQYKVFNDGNLESFNNFDTYSYWVPKTSCLGITLATNETILLECMVPKEKQEEPGCFQLISAENEQQLVCLKILNEACVGLTTPKNMSVALACYNSDNRYKIVNNSPENTFFLQMLKNYVNSRYLFIGASYHAYKENGNNQQESKRYQVEKLDDQSNCTGILTDTEIIILSCTDDKFEPNGCFNITKLRREVYNESTTNDQVANVCVTVLDSKCIGIITPDNLILQFSCFQPISVGLATSKPDQKTSILVSRTKGEELDEEVALQRSQDTFVVDIAPKTPIRIRRNSL